MTAGSDPAPSSGSPSPSSVSPSRPLPSSPSGLVLTPFRALRFDVAVAGDLGTLTSPPYDVIDDVQRTALEASNDHNVVRLILPRDSGEDRADTGDGADRDRYDRARRTLEQWRDAGILRPDPLPALYVYEQTHPVSHHVQRGLLGALALTPAEDGIVLPHENTMAGPVSDRLALYNAVDADLEPIFLVYDGGGAASRAVAAADAEPPLVDVHLPDGLRHRLWALTDPDLLEAIAADLHDRHALIADGHHRYATYLQRQAERRAAGAGAGPWDLGLTFLVDATAFGPEVHPIHRVIPGVPAERLAEQASAGMTVREVHGGLAAAHAELTEAKGPAYLVTDGDRVWLLDQPDAERLRACLPAERSEAWRSLDVSVLHGYLVPALWGLPDTVDAVGYEHDVDAAVATARRTGGSAVLLNPTPVAAVAAVAAGGERMPRKSTLFTPKPRTGLVIRDYRDA
jgi:uncharacterized protein (DUF1015 family)